MACCARSSSLHQHRRRELISGTQDFHSRRYARPHRNRGRSQPIPLRSLRSARTKSGCKQRQPRGRIRLLESFRPSRPAIKVRRQYTDFLRSFHTRYAQDAIASFWKGSKVSIDGRIPRISRAPFGGLQCQLDPLLLEIAFPKRRFGVGRVAHRLEGNHKVQTWRQSSRHQQQKSSQKTTLTHCRSARLRRTPAPRPAPPGGRRAGTGFPCSGSG